ncbi:discoidin domain-containing protein [Paenibacillus alvei]|uniref:discoidin domain-containing protein n=1 Tax=Paenibacillus alvei TaxID=44250 RepID=UPI0013DBB97F|nr:discoidin domain-containing protein [Paenibacillus alvei]NEZ40731.1 hypothetical protein [Paenibacillus alvei]
MKRKGLIVFFTLCLVFSVFTVAPANPVNASSDAASSGVSAIFGGGPFVTGGQSVANDVRASGFNTVIIWSVHVRPNGDLYLNDLLVCQNGSFVGDSSWKDLWSAFKQAPTSVTRVEISVGAGGTPDFTNIKSLITRDGIGSNTILYRNFAALIEATGADAVNFDNEDKYDRTSSVEFGKMLAAMGMKITFCPYNSSGFWSDLKNLLTQAGVIVDRVYLQVYSGGLGNIPSNWTSAMGMPVIPGLYASTSTTASFVKNKLAGWRSSIAGGFIWMYDYTMNMSSPNTTADYADAINSVFVEEPIPVGDIALNKTATANQNVSGETPAMAVDGSAYSKWCSNASGDKWLKIDLGQSYNISRWVVKHAGAGGESTSYNTKNFKLQKSSDGITWTDVDTVTNNTANITDRNVTAFSSRYVRLYITTPTQNTDIAARIYELELY